jgi:hypothetical protein
VQVTAETARVSRAGPSQRSQAVPDQVAIGLKLIDEAGDLADIGRLQGGD